MLFFRVLRPSRSNFNERNPYHTNTTTDSFQIIQLLKPRRIIDARLINLFVVLRVCDVMSKLVGLCPSPSLSDCLYSLLISLSTLPDIQQLCPFGCHFVVSCWVW